MNFTKYHFSKEIRKSFGDQFFKYQTLIWMNSALSETLKTSLEILMFAILLISVHAIIKS